MRFNAWTALSIAVLLLGIGLWLYIGSLNGGKFLDVGAYSVGITLVGLGAAGTLASMGRPAPA